VAQRTFVKLAALQTESRDPGTNISTILSANIKTIHYFCNPSNIDGRVYVCMYMVRVRV